MSNVTEDSFGGVRQNAQKPLDPPIRPECRFCGYSHGNCQCPAYGQTCRQSTLEIPEEVFHISHVRTGSRGMITIEVGKPTAESQVTFQLDTGAECNLMSMQDYRRATGDSDLLKAVPSSHKFMKTYTNEWCRILGSTELPTWPRGQRNVLQFNITEDDRTPLLSYRTCLDLGLVTINDCDGSSHRVCTATGDLLHEFSDVFEGLGGLPGEYHIVTDETVPPVVHPPRRVPVALRNQIKDKLDDLVASDILAPVTKPTAWVSSMLVVAKPNRLRICLDPRDLNQAIRREHY